MLRCVRWQVKVDTRVCSLVADAARVRTEKNSIVPFPICSILLLNNLKESIAINEARTASSEEHQMK